MAETVIRAGDDKRSSAIGNRGEERRLYPAGDDEQGSAIESNREERRQ
jgi:hypothetical protein